MCQCNLFETKVFPVQLTIKLCVSNFIKINLLKKNYSKKEKKKDCTMLSEVTHNRVKSKNTRKMLKS